jgi:hypothetical protein
MRKKVLIIFIDSLPYFIIKKRNLYINDLGEVVPISPGLGYSINIYAELFAGLSPDEIGFFNKWIPNTRVYESNIFKDLFFNILDYSRISPLLSRILHIIYGKLTKKGNIANIPFSYLKYFQKKENMDIFFTKKFPTIFNEFNLELCLSPFFKKRIGENDQKAYEMALNHVKSGKNVFLMLGDLDGISHIHGLESEYYNSYIEKLDQMCSTIIEEFKKENGDKSEIVVLSDHGMANVNEGIKINLERNFGKIGWNSYLYFLDSTYLRIWLMDQSLAPDIEEFLKGLKNGILLDDDLRNKYGITNRKFGDYIFILNEGKVFFPGFMGGRLVKAMHGYLPDFESQKGIFIHSNLYNVDIAPKSCKEVYNYIRGIMK